MAETPISSLASLLKANITISEDFLNIVDFSDKSMSVNGSNKKVTVADLVGCVTDDIESDLALLAVNTTNSIVSLEANKLDEADFLFANLGSKPTTLLGYGITDAQPVNANLTEIAALTTQPYGRSLLTQADAAAAQTTLGLGTLATQNGTISDYLLSATAASTYLPLTGGTLTGGLSGTSLTLSGITTINGGTQNAAGIQLGGSTVFGPYGLSNGWTFVQASAAQMRFSGGGIVVQSGKTLAWGNAFTDTGTTQLWEDASHVVAQRNGANAQTWRLYGTYTDASNYRRLYISSTTAGAFTLGVEGLGTGASGNTLTIANPVTIPTGSYSNPALTIGTSVNLYDSGGLVVTYSGQECFQFNQSELSLRTSVEIGWTATTSATGSIDSKFVRSDIGRVDLRGDSGFRARNLANNGWSAIECGALVAQSGTTLNGGASITGDVALTSRSNQIRIGTIGGSGPGIAIGCGANGSFDVYGYNGQSLGASFWNTNAVTPGLTFRSGYGVYWSSAATPDPNAADSAITRIGTGLVQVQANNGFRVQNYAANAWAALQCGTVTAAGTIAARNSTTSTQLEVHNTYTDASNYIRQALSFTTYSSTVHAQWIAEGLGTGAVNIPMVLTPRGTGAFILGPMPDGTSTGGNARGLYAIDLQLLRSAATQVVGDYGVGIGTQITVSGGSGSVSIGRNVSVTDSLGGSVGIGRNVTLTSYRSVGIGMQATSTSDAIAIGTNANASHNAAICIGPTTASRWAGTINWKSFTNTGSTAFLVNHLITGIQWGNAAVRTVNNTTTILDTSITTASIGSRQRHRGVLIYAKFTVCGIRSDGAINKYERRVSIKDLSNLDGTASTLSVLGVDTIGTDITEISGVSITIGVDNASKSLRVSVTGEPSYAVTGVAATNIITAVGHPFANNDIVTFTALSGGAGLNTNVNGTYYEPMYKVINVSGNDFQLALPGSGSTPIDFTTDITSGTICRPIVWSTEGADFHIAAGAY